MKPGIEAYFQDIVETKNKHLKDICNQIQQCRNDVNSFIEAKYKDLAKFIIDSNHVYNKVNLKPFQTSLNLKLFANVE
jgi:hypothetical protein